MVNGTAVLFFLPKIQNFETGSPHGRSSPVEWKVRRWRRHEKINLPKKTSTSPTQSITLANKKDQPQEIRHRMCEWLSCSCCRSLCSAVWQIV